MFPVEKILVFILLVLILKTERIHIIVNVTIVLVYLNLAKIRRYYRESLRTLELHALFAELELLQLVGWLNGVAWSASYFVSVRIVIQIL